MNAASFSNKLDRKLVQTRPTGLNPLSHTRKLLNYTLIVQKIPCDFFIFVKGTAKNDL